MPLYMEVGQNGRSKPMNGRIVTMGGRGEAECLLTPYDTASFASRLSRSEPPPRPAPAPGLLAYRPDSETFRATTMGIHTRARLQPARKVYCAKRSCQVTFTCIEQGAGSEVQKTHSFKSGLALSSLIRPQCCQVFSILELLSPGKSRNLEPCTRCFFFSASSCATKDKSWCAPSAKASAPKPYAKTRAEPTKAGVRDNKLRAQSWHSKKTKNSATSSPFPLTHHDAALTPTPRERSTLHPSRLLMP